MYVGAGKGGGGGDLDGRVQHAVLHADLTGRVGNDGEVNGDVVLACSDRSRVSTDICVESINTTYIAYNRAKENGCTAIDLHQSRSSAEQQHQPKSPFPPGGWGGVGGVGGGGGGSQWATTSFSQAVWLSTASQERVASLTPLESSSLYFRASRPISVVHTGVKSAGWLRRQWEYNLSSQTCVVAWH